MLYCIFYHEFLHSLLTQLSLVGFSFTNPGKQRHASTQLSPQFLTQIKDSSFTVYHKKSNKILPQRLYCRKSLKCGIDLCIPAFDFRGRQRLLVLQHKIVSRVNLEWCTDLYYRYNPMSRKSSSTGGIYPKIFGAQHCYTQSIARRRMKSWIRNSTSCTDDILLQGR